MLMQMCMPLPFPAPWQPGQARTSTGNEVGRHLRSLLRGLLVGPSTSWLSRSSNGLRTRTHPVRGAVMRGRVQQAPQSARTSCRSTAQQLNVGFVADSEMSNQQLSRRCTAAPQQLMGRTTRPGSSPRSHRSASVGGPRGDSGRVRQPDRAHGRRHTGTALLSSPRHAKSHVVKLLNQRNHLPGEPPGSRDLP